MSTADTFHAAARRGDYAECKRLLGLDKELVHSRDGGGRTLLHHWAALDPSCEQASCAALTWARTYEVELDAVNDKTGLTPLHRALMSENKTFALALVEAGANPHLATAKERRTPLDMCRDDAFRTELLAGAQQASAHGRHLNSPPPSAASSASQGQPHRQPSVDGGHDSVAATVESKGAGSPRDGGPGSAASPPPSTSFVPTGPAPPPRPHPAAGERQDSGEEVRFQPLAKRRLVLPDAASLAALNVAWTRIAASLPALDRGNAHVQALAYGGIPPALRPQLYFAACGAAAARDVAGRYGITFDALHAHLAPQFLALSDLNQIDKDVRRTGLRLNASAAASLRRLLRALTLTCPSGYTQSMNSLAALCLVLWPEDECAAFWALFCLVRIVQPAGMYAGALDVPRVAAAAVAAAVLRCKPALAATLSDVDEACSEEETCGPGSQGALLLSSLILPWLMCCYVGATPLELTLRIWDVLFLVGPEGNARVAASLLLSVADAAAAAGGQAAALGTLSRGVTTELAEVLSPPLIDDIMHRARCLEWPRTGAAQGGQSSVHLVVASEQGEQSVRALVADARAHVQRLNAKLDAAGGVAEVAKGAFQGLKARLARARARPQHATSSSGDAGREDGGAAQQPEQAPPVPQQPHEACAAALCWVRDRYTAASLRSPCFSALLALAATQLACEPGLEDAEAGDAACAVPQCLFSGHVDVGGPCVPSTPSAGTDEVPPHGEDDDAAGPEPVAGELSPEAQREAHQLLGAPAGAEALRQLRALLDSTL